MRQSINDAVTSLSTTFRGRLPAHSLAEKGEKAGTELLLGLLRYSIRHVDLVMDAKISRPECRTSQW